MLPLLLLLALLNDAGIKWPDCRPPNPTPAAALSEVQRLEFERFAFGNAELPAPSLPDELPVEAEPLLAELLPELAAVEAYVASVNQRVDAEEVALMLCVAAAEAGLDPWLLAAIAKHEATFDPHARGEAGERGLLQILPVHKANFPAAGCDWDDPLDQLRFGAAMIAGSLERGASLKAALQPWSVRADALAEYARLQKLHGDSLNSEAGS